jgi:hypothetical protein
VSRASTRGLAILVEPDGYRGAEITRLSSHTLWKMLTSIGRDRNDFVVIDALADVSRCERLAISSSLDAKGSARSLTLRVETLAISHDGDCLTSGKRLRATTDGPDERSSWLESKDFCRGSGSRQGEPA